MAMSGNRVFGGSRYEPRGRNADMSNMMAKRTPIFQHYQAEKIESSPFLNYNAKTGESFISDGSNVTLPEDRLSPEAVRQLIKEEITKNQGPEDTNRKLIHTLQAQITDLKERIAQYEKQNSKKLQQSALSVKEDIRTEAERLQKEIEEEITSKLRSFFQKANYELKKDILKQVGDDFLSIQYGEDLENRLELINNRIQTLTANVNSAQSKQLTSQDIQEKLDKASLVDSIEPRVSKLEKESESMKKHNQEVNSRLKGLQQIIEQKKTAEEEMVQKIEGLKQKLKGLDVEFQKKVNGIDISLSSTGGDINIMREKINELQKYNEEQRALFLDFNKKLSGNLEASMDQSTSILMSSNFIEKGTDNIKKEDKIEEKKEEVKSSGNKAVVKEIKQIKAQVKQQKQDLTKSVYQVDNEGYLMDGEGKYLLTEEGTMIKLNQQQIDALFDSKVIEILEQ